MAAREPAAKDLPIEDGERLLVEAAQQDPAKFGNLYEIHFDNVYAFIARRVLNRDAAEDLTSEVFNRALANLRNYEWRGSPFVVWLFRIAANAIADRAKRASREVQNSPDTPEPSIEPDMERIENTARLFRMVEQLPEDQRNVIFNRFVEQRSIREIAHALGRSEGAVKQLQFRALQKLRVQMEGGNA